MILKVFVSAVVAIVLLGGCESEDSGSSVDEVAKARAFVLDINYTDEQWEISKYDETDIFAGRQKNIVSYSATPSGDTLFFNLQSRVRDKENAGDIILTQGIRWVITNEAHVRSTEYGYLFGYECSIKEDTCERIVRCDKEKGEDDITRKGDNSIETTTTFVCYFEDSGEIITRPPDESIGPDTLYGIVRTNETLDLTPLNYNITAEKEGWNELYIGQYAYLHRVDDLSDDSLHLFVEADTTAEGFVEKKQFVYDAY